PAPAKKATPARKAPAATKKAVKKATPAKKTATATKKTAAKKSGTRRR
ncbi:MAG: hypothetical protein QOJ09_3075, partial [Actinomycetota bacterium]|nr:hypothetical protein [Actinomycetota bacterium]